jgi:hypothetical protein
MQRVLEIRALICCTSLLSKNTTRTGQYGTRLSRLLPPPVAEMASCNRWVQDCRHTCQVPREREKWMRLSRSEHGGDHPASEFVGERITGDTDKSVVESTSLSSPAEILDGATKYANGATKHARMEPYRTRQDTRHGWYQENALRPSRPRQKIKSSQVWSRGYIRPFDSFAPNHSRLELELRARQI